jgi:hypothetical protein
VPYTPPVASAREPFVDARDYALSQAADADNSDAINAAITDAVGRKKMLSLPGGLFPCTGTLHIPSGLIMRGNGHDPLNGTPTRLSFANINGNSPSFTLNAVSEVSLSDFYLTGRAAGAASEIACYGNCRGISLDRITVNSASTGAGVHFGVTGSVIRSSIKGVTVVNADYGFWIGGACTSITVANTYANNCAVAGYNIKGTYLALLGTAADANGLYGYIFQDAVGVGLVGCGAESNNRAGWHFTNANAISLVGCRGHLNNLAGGTYPSFASLNDDSKNISMLGCAESSPHAATPYSVSSFSGTVNPVTILNCDFPQGVSPVVDNAVSADSFRAAASSANRAGLRLPHGVAPTSPVNGDMWTTTAGLFVRVNGTTVGPLS